jgi:hypothetical protein
VTQGNTISAALRSVVDGEEDGLAGEVLMEAVIVALLVFEQERCGPGLSGLMA